MSAQNGPVTTAVTPGNISSPFTSPQLHFSDTHKALTALGMGSIILLALFGNALVIFAFSLFKNVRSVNNCFILSLAVSDMLVVLIPLPMWMTYILSDGTWWCTYQIRHTIIRAWVFFDVTCGVASILLLAVISVERYICVAHSLFYQRNATKKKAFVVVVVVCAIVVSLASSRVAYFDVPRPTFELIFAFGCFLFPFLVIIAMYFMLLRFVRRRIVAGRTAATTAGARSLGVVRFFRETKTAKVMIVIVVVFFICWFPFFLLHFMVLCGECTRAAHKPAIITAVKWLHYSNSCVNPIIYAGMSKEFRKCFMAILVNVFGCFCNAGRKTRQRQYELSAANNNTCSSTVIVSKAAVISETKH